MSTLVPIISASAPHIGAGQGNSWIAIQNDQNRVLYAQAVYSIDNKRYDTVSSSNILTTNGLILSANPARKVLFCRNLIDEVSTPSSTLYLKFGAGASTVSFNIPLKSTTDGLGESFYDVQPYTGPVSIFCSALNRKYILWEGY